MTSVPKSPVRCPNIKEMGYDGNNRLIRACLRTEGHPGRCDFGVIKAEQPPSPSDGSGWLAALVAAGILLAALAALVFLALFLAPAGEAQAATPEIHKFPDGSSFACWPDGCMQLTAATKKMDAKPRCAIVPLQSPRILGSNPKGQKFIWAEFINKCLDPVLEMGSFACLEEFNTPGGPPKVVDCHANIDRTPFTLLPPHETNVFMVAKCNYTTIPRYYKVTGYAWAVSLPSDSTPPTIKYWRGPREGKYESKKVMLQRSGPGDVHFCDISPAGTSWRNFR